MSAPTFAGDLLVAARDNSEFLDWELIYRSNDHWTIKQDSYELEMAGPEGIFAGTAILVRTDGRTHVFRGSGQLEGLTTVNDAKP